MLLNYVAFLLASIIDYLGLSAVSSQGWKTGTVMWIIKNIQKTPSMAFD